MQTIYHILYTVDLLLDTLFFSRKFTCVFKLKNSIKYLYKIKYTFVFLKIKCYFMSK